MGEGLARLDLATVHVDDDDVGAYDAPALKITLPGPRIVWVRPVGTLRVGAQGIVDVVCGSSRALLVLNRAGVWKVRGAGPNAAPRPARRARLRAAPWGSSSCDAAPAKRFAAGPQSTRFGSTIP